MKVLNRITGGHTRRIILDPALWITGAFTDAVTILMDDQNIKGASGLVGSAQAQVGTALLGVVIAGLAILIVFLNEDYLALLDQIPPGAEADLAPFVITAFVAAVTAGLGVLLILVGVIDAPSLILRVVFLLSLWSFLYLLWHTFDLVVFLMGHARIRIAQMRARRTQQNRGG